MNDLGYLYLRQCVAGQAARVKLPRGVLFPDLHSMTAKTETELARILGCTRSMLNVWRKEHLDAPTGKDVEAWKQFLTEHNLGQRTRGSAKDAAIEQAEQHLLNAETSLYMAQRAIARANSRKGAAIGSVRGKMVPMFERLWMTLN